ncbi:MAG TPA: ABC transporter permease [Gemmatimonadales bacterium]|nr:ABC transporter permease [Gemmatimonadales bacterium]
MTTRPTVALIGAIVVTMGIVELLRRRTRHADGWRRFFAHPAAAWGLRILVFFTIAALAAPLLAPFDPNAQPGIVTLQNTAPSWTHPLGTDLYSSDIWSRLVYGGRVSLGIGLLATLVAMTVGVTVGAIAGYTRGWIDGVLMRLVDVGLAVPRIFMLLLAVAYWDRIPLLTLILLLGLTGWFTTSRLVRAEALSIRARPFVDAARALGASPIRIVARHVLPAAAAPIIVSAVLSVGNVMLLEAGLSFLGFGVQPPTPSWGTMVADGQGQLALAPWTSFFPGLTIAIVVMSWNAVGDALRDAFDPRPEQM